MYKTIRHGENSLQYTILPQSDDFKIEGKFPTSCNAGSNNNNSAVHHGAKSCNKTRRRPRRRSFFAYLGLIFVCTVIVGAVLIPFLVSTECLSIPSEWFMKTKAAFTQSVVGSAALHSNNDSNNVKTPALRSDAQIKSPLENSMSIGKKVKIFNNHGLEKIILKMNKPSSNDSAAHQQAGQRNASAPTAALNTTRTDEDSVDNNKLKADGLPQADEPALRQDLYNGSQTKIVDEAPEKSVLAEIRFDKGHNLNVTNGVAPTIVVTTVRNPNGNHLSNGLFPLQTQTKLHSATLQPTSQTPNAKIDAMQYQQRIERITITPSAISTVAARIMQVPLLKAAAKKPVYPPVLAKANSEVARNKTNASPSQTDAMANANNDTSLPATTDSVDRQSSKDGNWMTSHWPYIDPSTYFQWDNYKTEDSVLLPALLGFALIGVILIITVCLIARNKRTIVASVRKRNRNDIEETGAEDNTTLLTTTNLSDDD